MKHYIVLVSFLCAITIACAWECPVLRENAESDTHSKLFEGQQKFTVNFLKEALKQDPHKSIFFSPYSIYRALLLAYAGSSGATETALKSGLHLDWSRNRNEVISEYLHEKKQRLANAKLETSVEFESADKFFFDQQVAIRDCMKTLFSDEIELLDIHNKPKDAVRHINAWVEQVTHNHIKNLLASDAIDSSTPLTIANAAYFKGAWVHKFDAKKTVQAEFFKTPTEQVTIDMMSQLNAFNLGSNEELNANILKLPYDKTNPAGGDISFVLILPNEGEEGAHKEMINKLTPEILSEVLSQDSNRKAHVLMPKFKLEHTTTMTPVRILN